MELNAVCVHAHFYQPPREDPLSGLIPDEVGAEPYRNWNERIHAECYRPNALLGNFEKISFNIGPTLFGWMEYHDKETYDLIISQERKNYLTNGVGNGMAQAYNHIILPLAKKQDKITQVKWGIADFKHRYGHEPLGMWLPETAVDLETLSILADNQIKFTLLAPWQIQSSEKLENDQAYLIALPGNREPMIVFLYERNLSTAVSFRPETTRNAEFFIDQYLIPSFVSSKTTSDQITIIASDGELYGHHRSFRDKFLAHILNGALKQRNVQITYPGLWLQSHQPQKFIKLNENTSWSCHHGIVRWMGECGCTPGASWKAPLRYGLEKLAEEIDQEYISYMKQFTDDVWKVRNDYIDVFLGKRSLENLLKDHISQTLSPDQISGIGMILAAQYERQRVFTSCGWFFDNFHRIEPQNNIAYAAQAVWLTNQVTGADLKTKAIALLKNVRDPHTGLRGDTVFMEKYLRSANFSEDKVSYFNLSSNFSS